MKSRLIDSCSTVDATSRFLYREQQTPCSCTDNSTVNKRVSQSVTGLKASRCHDRSQTPSAMSAQSDPGAAVLRALRPSRFIRTLSTTLRADADLSFCLSVHQVKRQGRPESHTNTGEEFSCFWTNTEVN